MSGKTVGSGFTGYQAPYPSPRSESLLLQVYIFKVGTTRLGHALKRYTAPHNLNPNYNPPMSFEVPPWVL